MNTNPGRRSWLIFAGVAAFAVLAMVSVFTANTSTVTVPTAPVAPGGEPVITSSPAASPSTSSNSTDSGPDANLIAAGAASDVAMALVATSLSYTPYDSAAGIAKAVRGFASPDVVNQVAATALKWDWDAIKAANRMQVAEVASAVPHLDSGASSSGIPHVVDVTVRLFVSENGGELRAAGEQTWRVTIGSSSGTSSWTGTSLTRLK